MAPGADQGSASRRAVRLRWTAADLDRGALHVERARTVDPVRPSAPRNQAWSISGAGVFSGPNHLVHHLGARVALPAALSLRPPPGATLSRALWSDEARRLRTSQRG
jgi:hypothetical protein